MIWTATDVDEYIKKVAPPGDVSTGYDDRVLFTEALEIAEYEGADGLLLLNALKAMEK